MNYSDSWTTQKFETNVLRTYSVNFWTRSKRRFLWERSLRRSGEIGALFGSVPRPDRLVALSYSPALFQLVFGPGVYLLMWLGLISCIFGRNDLVYSYSLSFWTIEWTRSSGVLVVVCC